MNNLKTRELTVMAISVALMVVLGTFLYLVGRSLPIPGGRLLAMAPAYGFIFTAVVLRVKKIGVVTLMSLVFGLFVLRFSLISVVCIWVSAILADLLTYFIIRKYKSYKDIYMTIPINGFFQVWVSFFAVTLFVPDSKFTQVGAFATLIISIAIYLISYLTSKFFIKLMQARSLVGEDFDSDIMVAKYESR